MESKFTIRTRELNESLIEIKKIQRKYFENGIAKIRLMPGGIEISGQGIYKAIHGETEGLSEIFVPLKLLYSFSSSHKYATITFIFREGEMQCGSSIFSLPSIKVESWFNSPDLKLNINSDDFEILRELFLRGDNYMKIHKLEEKVKIANTKLNSAINIAYTSLKAFKISKAEILNLVNSKLKEVQK